MDKRYSAGPIWDVAVIGAGIGGLTAGALLADAGARVIICEQHHRLGGYCHYWSRIVRAGSERLKFTFDAAVHDISGAYLDGPVRTILRRLDLDSQIEWGRTSHEYCLPFGSFHVDEECEAYVRALQKRFPADAVGIYRFFSILRESYGEMLANATCTGGLPRAPRNAHEMQQFCSRCPTFSKFIGVPFVEMRDSLLQDPDLRQLVSILSAYVTDDVGQLSFANMLPLFGYYFRGGHYPRGGSQRLANVLAERIIERNGQICLRSAVSSIRIIDRRASGLILADGSHLRANVVISNADPAQTFHSILEPQSATQILAHAGATFKPTNSAFMVFLGLNIDPPLASSTIVVHGQDGAILSCPPFVEDRAPNGYSTLTLTSLIESSAARQWQRSDANYKRMKREAGDKLIALAAHRIPDLDKHIMCREDASPATLRRYTWATDSAAYGATVGTRWPGHETLIDGLYLVGASTGLGPGIEAVMIGGASLAEIVSNRLGKHGTATCETYKVLHG